MKRWVSCDFSAVPCSTTTTGNQNTHPFNIYSYENAAPDVVPWRDAHLWRKYQETDGLWVNQRKTVLDVDVCRWGDHAPRIHRISAHSAPFIGDMLWGKAPKEKHRYFIFTQVVVTGKKKNKKSCFLLITVSNGRWMINCVSTLLPDVQGEWTEKRYQTLTGEIFMVPCSGKTEEHVEQIWSKTGGGSDGSDDTSFGCGKKFFAEEKHSGKYTCSTW